MVIEEEHTFFLLSDASHVHRGGADNVRAWGSSTTSSRLTIFRFSLRPRRERTEGSDRVIQEYFDKYGPDTRFACVTALEMDSCFWESQANERLEQALEGLTLAWLQVLFRESRGPRFDAESVSAILCIRPGAERGVMEVNFASTHALLRCAYQLSLSLYEMSEHFPGLLVCGA